MEAHFLRLRKPLMCSICVQYYFTKVKDLLPPINRTIIIPLLFSVPLLIPPPHTHTHTHSHTHTHTHSTKKPISMFSRVSKICERCLYS